MFKFNKNMGRSTAEERQERTTGHDRFCTQKIQLPRYRRRKNPHKRSQAETDLLFELSSYASADSSMSSNGGPGRCRRFVQEVQWPKRALSALNLTLPSSSATAPPPAQQPQFEPAESDGALLGNCVDQNRFHEVESTGYVTPFQSEEQPISSWGSIGRFFSTVATSLSCRNGRRNSDPELAKSVFGNDDKHRSSTAEYDYGTRQENGRIGETFLYNDYSDTGHHSNMAKAEKAAGHTACMTYLKNSNGRYVLLEQLPDIGWRTNRLWYVICDARVNAKRLLVATPCHSRSAAMEKGTKNVMTLICRSLQHPYVSPVLDMETIHVENFDRPFTLVVVPMTMRGSLRDVYHKCNWSEAWLNKYSRKGTGLTEGHAQRLSCHVLEAMLELKSRGLPAGIGGHVHSGNIIIQHGTARFAGLDNVLLGHSPRAMPHVSHYLRKDPEALDSISFAFLLFSMCTGYDVTTIKLTPQNWIDVRDYAQVVPVLQFILENPEHRIPTLREISAIEFYRHVDLRELRSLPLPNIMAGPEMPPVRTLLEYLNSQSHKFPKHKKLRPTSIVSYHENRRLSHGVFIQPLFESPPRDFLEKPLSQSTPSITKLLEDSPMHDRNYSYIKEIRNNSISLSSQISVYCTPPDSMAEAFKGSLESSNFGSLRTMCDDEPV